MSGVNLEKWVGDNLRTIVLVGFIAGVMVVAGLGFAFKMSEFSTTIMRNDVEGFGASAIGIYLSGAIPLLFLTLWAILTGRFRDIERPKYRLLEMHEEIEAEARRGYHG